MSGNVLVTETIRGLAGFDRPQRAYLFCLVFQAAVLLTWWPGKSVTVGQSSPPTLFAVLIAFGVTLSYQSIRQGAEELMFASQQSLREWLLSTSVPLVRLCLGYVVGHLLQTLHWVLLSIPLVLVAWSIDGGNWSGLWITLGIVVLIGSTYRVAGICLYLAIGQYGQVTWYTLRATLALGFIAAAVVFPATNFWKLTDALLLMSYTGDQPAALTGFVLFYAFWVVLLGAMAMFLARRIRNQSIRAGL